jgi:predicted TIM-barrel fold metal-dependent hydrolase
MPNFPIIDTHLHIWDIERLETGLYRGFGPVNGIALTPATRIGCQYLDCNRFSIK